MQVSVLVEIFWPVFLYIIMAILRVKFKPEFHQDSKTTLFLFLITAVLSQDDPTCNLATARIESY